MEELGGLVRGLIPPTGQIVEQGALYFGGLLNKPLRRRGWTPNSEPLYFRVGVLARRTNSKQGPRRNAVPATLCVVHAGFCSRSLKEPSLRVRSSGYHQKYGKP